jgi:hypothetical protein
LWKIILIWANLIWGVLKAIGESIVGIFSILDLAKKLFTDQEFKNNASANLNNFWANITKTGFSGLLVKFGESSTNGLLGELDKFDNYDIYGQVQAIGYYVGTIGTAVISAKYLVTGIKQLPGAITGVITSSKNAIYSGYNFARALTYKD